MRLLKIDDNGELSFTQDLIQDIPPYAILSHTWGPDEDEVTFNDLKNGSGKTKAGYGKILFCSQQAQKDQLEYIWVDTCCIDKANYTELTEAITSMFRWYRDAKECYVFLSDVSTRKRQLDQTVPKWESAFQSSRWFTRGWTLQELLAPKSLNFFSREHDPLGNRNTLEQEIHQATGIPLEALRGVPLSNFSTEDRMRWAAKRDTKKIEDRAYCLFGIFGVFLPLIYGEGDNASIRLKGAISQSLKEYSHCKKQLLESLNFGSPFTRSERIEGCSEGTFTWIFDDQSSESTGPEAQLCQWLTRGDGVFWIIGKPGSGKSTIMKFLAGTNNQNQQTMQCLETWARPRKSHILSFYFWLDDTSGIQNSFRGFVCHLLHQLLSNSSPAFVSSLPLIDRYRQKCKITDWSPEDLETLLKDVACRVAVETPLCFFVDALDECKSTDIDRVVRVIEALALRSDSKIKFCVSSRPEQKLYNRLGGFAAQRLALHKLTERDIRRYVTDQFERCWRGDISPTDEQKKDLIDQLVSSSEGVFLWAFLVAKKLCDAIEFGDSISQLQEQLEELPIDMIKLYENMIGKSDATKGHRMAEAAMYFKYVVDHGQRHLWHNHREFLKICLNAGLENLVPFYERYHEKISHKSLQSVHNIIRQRINFLCAGIVLIRETESPEVYFFHRTARDFFREPSGKEILQQCKLTQLESYCLFVDAESTGHTCSRHELNAYESRQMIRWLDEMKESTDADKLKFLQHVNKAMSQVHAMENGVANENWVYHQAKLELGDDRVLDFVTLASQTGSTELLSQFLSMKRSLSGRYKDYLLMCSSQHGFLETGAIALAWRQNFFESGAIAPAWRQNFLESGANPNASFYWGLQDRVKTSPWLQYLVDTRQNYNRDGGSEDDFDGLPRLPNNDLDMDTINAFLDNGASLDDRTVLFKGLFHRQLGSVEFRVLPPRSSRDLYSARGMYLVIEVNAKYLLEEQCRPERVRSCARRSKVLFRSDVQKSQSYRRVLLIHPGYSSDDVPPDTPSEYSKEESLGESAPEELEQDKNDSKGTHDSTTVSSPGKLHPLPFAEIDCRESERLLDGLKLVPHLGQLSHGGQLTLLDEVFTRKEEEILEMWQRSPKVQDIRQYLEDKGYYKKADDPAVLQGPIPMFEDEE